MRKLLIDLEDSVHGCTASLENSNHWLVAGEGSIPLSSAKYTHKKDTRHANVYIQMQQV